MKQKRISDNQIHEARIKVPANPKRTLSFRECQAVAGEQLAACQKQVDELEKEVVKEIAIYIRQLPTDGHDKWYFYHQDLAVDIELKYLKKSSEFENMEHGLPKINLPSVVDTGNIFDSEVSHDRKGNNG